MFDWLPWAISIVFLLGIGGMASVAFRGGAEHGRHINWEADEARHGAARAAARGRVAEYFYRSAYALLAVAVTGGTIAMLVSAAVLEGGE